MWRFLFWRLVQSIVVLWAVYTVTFVLLAVAPGDPFIGEKRPSETMRRALAQKYGLDYLAQNKKFADLRLDEKLRYTAISYGNYLRRALSGDLGLSTEFENFTVAQIIAAALPVSMTLGSAALVVALWLGVGAGAIGSVWKGKWEDVGLSVVTLLGVSLPSFVVGSLLIMAFVVVVPVFPAGGWGVTGGGITGELGSVARMVLPVVTLAAFFLAYIARLTRASMVEVLAVDYVRTARAKGVRPSRVFLRHVGANAALPILSYLGPAAANVLVGSFVVEKLFAIPGLGTHFVNACLNKDIPLVLGTVLVYSALVIGFNLLVDFAYAAVDPRISLR